MNGIAANTTNILKENSNIGRSYWTKLKTNWHFNLYSNKNNRFECSFAQSDEQKLDILGMNSFWQFLHFGIILNSKICI